MARGAPLAPGYTVLAHLERTGRCDLYEVYSHERACRCVAKALRPDWLRESEEDPTALQQLLREGRLLRQLLHPHIVRAYEVVREPLPAIILERLRGETLAARIATRGQSTVREVARLGLQLCSALRYLHGQRLLHLDVKPANVIVADGRATLIDLGLARRPGRAQLGEGTPLYLAPEQARGALLSAATDVWGLGVTLYEAAVGRAAFAARDAAEELIPLRQLARRAEPVARGRRLPRRLSAVIDACLDPDPDRRPDLLLVVAALESQLAGGR